jgi:isoleucyl-tRNA synthetase
MFEKVDPNTQFADEELRVLEFWEAEQIFEKSKDQRQGCPEYVFYDGPPFATGLPHYGHLLASTIKDVVPRYQTMAGKYVDRVFGWDCHGLPVENEMEKELGIASKHEIEALGVDTFNESCRGIVLRYTSEWEGIIRRLGRWVDFRNGYRTMDRDFMESIWWVFKTLWDKQLIYEGHKILPYCPRCATPLSNFEVNQNYKDVDDPSVTIRFRVPDAEVETYLLAWTTTPWTLPSNLALCVGDAISYVVVEDDGTHYVLARERLGVYYADTEPTIVRELSGSELVGWRYEPLFPYFAPLAADGAFVVISGDFVSTEDGTGIVHTAPGFGEDDARVAEDHGVPTVCPVDAECCFTEEVTDYTGQFTKDCDSAIIRQLKDEGKLVHRSTCHHSYPHCWRCERPLIYRAVSTWFVKVTAIKDAMLAANDQIRWVPEHLKHGRFGKWLENAHDWAISRNRYWGCPLPVWKDEESGECLCVGSISELEELCGTELPDIHKHFVDGIVVTADGREYRRVPEVLDCWFESGAMPYAQRHYPFENKEWLENNFPADFIAEGLDQTRGWFYTLVVLGAGLMDRPVFKNVVVNGLVLDKNGKKMSKKEGNYPDPNTLMGQYGADALRLCLLGSPVVRAEDLRFSEDGVREVMRGILLPLWNAYSFFVTYASVDGWRPDGSEPAPANPLDRWILSRVESSVAAVRDRLDNYDLQGAATSFTGLIDSLTNWYIRRSRRRFWKSANDADKHDAYATLYHVLILFCRSAAPQIPFITETIYRNLRSDSMPESVHLCDFPEAAEQRRDAALERQMARIITAVSLGRHLRTTAKLRVRQPLREVLLVSSDDEVRSDLERFKDLVTDELNVKQAVVHGDETELVALSAKANFRSLGPKLGPRMRAAAAAVEQLTSAEVEQLVAGGALELPAFDDGPPVELAAADIDVRRTEKPGLAVANDGAITVALDLRVDDELEREGLAREVVNRVQKLRREAGLEVSDRIVLQHHVPAQIGLAIDHYATYIADETLAAEIVSADDLQTPPIDILGHECRFAVSKLG